ncbi:hypothetical protein E1264_25075 [Actinomadura sp. KC216]|nr:hypothetical protein E1264_25075 [Actinomadura sp. KC216]
MPPELDHGLIHGDAHTGNVIPVRGGFVACDWDSVSLGPRAQDLILASTASFASAAPEAPGWRCAPPAASTPNWNTTRECDSCIGAGNSSPCRLHPCRRALCGGKSRAG